MSFIRRAIWPGLLTLVLVTAGCTGAGETAQEPGSPTRTIDIHAFQWGFRPDTIRIQAGETVSLRIHATLEQDTLYSVHGFYTIGMATKIDTTIPRGETVTVTLTGHQPGTYEFLCSQWCGDGHGHMKGVIVVE